MNLLHFLINSYEKILHTVAMFTIYSLELVGIFIIIIGTIKALTLVFSKLIKKQPVNIVISLGKSLALALEFKMGAEIINTVVVRDLKELGILAVVILIRALLSLLIHWEIKNERKDERKL